MPLLEWKDEFSVNVAEFDVHHKQIIEMLNELYDAMRSRKGKKVLGGILENLVKYCKVHFTAEEKTLRQYYYPDYQEHKDKHESMTENVLALQKNYLMGKKDVTIDSLNFLRKWLRKHILITDKKYAGFLNGKGLK